MQNYDEQFATGDYETMLLDPRVVEAVEINMATNKASSTAPPSPSPAPRPPSAAFSEHKDMPAAFAAEMAGSLPIMMYGSGSTNAPAVPIGESAGGTGRISQDAAALGEGGDGGNVVATPTRNVWYGRLAEDSAPQVPVEGGQYGGEHQHAAPPQEEEHHQQPQDDVASSEWAGFDEGEAGQSEWGPAAVDQYEGGTAAEVESGGDGPGESMAPGYNEYDQYGQYDQQYTQQYDQQYGQYHTTEQYHVETNLDADMDHSYGQATATISAVDNSLAPPPNQSQEDDNSTMDNDPTLGQVLGSFLRPVSQEGSQGAGAEAALGHLMESVGGTLKGFFTDVAAAAAAAGQGDMYSELEGSTSLGKKEHRLSSEMSQPRWGGESAAAEHGNGNGTTAGEGTNDGTTNGSTAFQTPEKSARPQYESYPDQFDQMPPTPGDLGLFSPGQLAADLGVPRAAVTMSALFDAEGGSVGTLSSQNSIQDGWSDDNNIENIPLPLPSNEIAATADEGNLNPLGEGHVEQFVGADNEGYEPMAMEPIASAAILGMEQGGEEEKESEGDEEESSAVPVDTAVVPPPQSNGHHLDQGTTEWEVPPQSVLEEAGTGGDGWESDGLDLDLPQISNDLGTIAVATGEDGDFTMMPQQQGVVDNSWGGTAEIVPPEHEEDVFHAMHAEGPYPAVVQNEYQHQQYQPYQQRSDQQPSGGAFKAMGSLPFADIEPETAARGGEGVGASSELTSDAFAELNALRAQVQESQAAAAAARQELESLREEGAVQAAALAEVLGARDALSRENSELLQELNALRGDVVALHQYEERCQQLETELEEKSAAAEGARAEAAALQSERDELVARVAGLESSGTNTAGADEAKMTAAAGEIAVLQAELDELKESLEARESEIDDLKSVLELKDDAISQLKVQEGHANEEKSAAVAAVATRDAEISSLREELAAAQEALAAAEADASDRVASALEDVRNRMQTAVAEAISEKDAELSRLENALREEMAAQAAQLAAAEAELCTTVDEKDGEIMQLEARVMTLEQEATEAKALSEAATAAAAAKENDLQTAQARAKEMERKFAIARKKIAAQQAQQESLVAEMAALKAQVESGSAGQDAELAQMAAALEAAAEEHERLMQEAATLQARLIAAEEAQTSSSGRDNELAEMTAALTSAHAAQEALAAEASALQARLDELSAAKDGEIAAMATAHDSELSAMSAALDAATTAQQTLSAEANSLQARLDEVNAAKAAEMQAMAADYEQIIEMLGQRDSTLEAMNLEIETLRETAESAAASSAQIAELAAELNAAREQVAQWTFMAEDTTARCTAAEQALAAERAAREEAAAAAAVMQQELASLQGVLAATEAQLNEVAAMQDAASRADVEALRQQVADLEAELAAARAAVQSFNRGEFEDAVEEVEELKSQLTVASQLAAAKEEELRKYKLQLVKAKKVRAADAEKIAALEEAKAAADAAVSAAEARAAEAAAAATAAAAAAAEHVLPIAAPVEVSPSGASAEEMASLREEITALQEQLDALRAVSAEGDEGLNEALSALGAEEAKVARLAEMLVERGVAEGVVEEELAAIEEMMVLMEEEDAAEESLC